MKHNKALSLMAMTLALSSTSQIIDDYKGLDNLKYSFAGRKGYSNNGDTKKMKPKNLLAKRKAKIAAQKKARKRNRK